MITSVIEPLLIEECSPSRLRLYEKGDSVEPFWGKISSLGFADVALSEADGGAGLSLADIGQLIALLGKYLVPIPLADTIIARALLKGAGQDIPDGLIVLATSASSENIETGQILLASVAHYALIECPDGIVLTTITPDNLVSYGDCRTLSSSLRITENQTRLIDKFSLPLQVVSAALRSAEMTGMLSKMLEMSVQYTNERVQFTKKIGRFQAVQQQLAVLAEECSALHMASTLAFMGPDLTVLWTSAAKMRAGSAGTKAISIAHAVHGAMGFSEEYDLQLYTRRVIECRFIAGSEAFWAAELGRLCLDSSSKTSLDFVLSGFS